MTRIAKPIPVLFTLLLATGTILAGEEKPSSNEKKEAAPAKAQTEAPVSPIYRASRDAADEKSSGDVEVITNEDLERMWAGLSPTQRLQGVYQAERHIGTAAPADAGTAPASRKQGATQWLEQQQADAAKARGEEAEAEKRVAELQRKVQDLERRLLAVRNPLMPRRYSDRKDDEVENWDEMSNPDRVATTEEELKQAKEDLAAAQRDLARRRGAER